MSVENPYEIQTRRNVDSGRTWIRSGEDIDVDTDGLLDYAKNVAVVGQNLMADMKFLDPLGGLPDKAWFGATLGEAAISKTNLVHNVAEFMEYVSYLHQALYNVASAAQTVAQVYRSADATSAATLDVVKWAFGDDDVSRPSGAPPGIGRTWLEAHIEGTAQASAGGRAIAADEWTDLGRTTNPDGSVTLRAINQKGQYQSITTGANAQGRYTTTVAPDGTATTSTTSVSRWPTGAQETTVTTIQEPGGQPKRTGTQITTWSTGTTTTSRYDGVGNLVTVTTERLNADGSTTQTEVHYRDGDEAYRTQLDVGPRTIGQSAPEYTN